MIMFVSGTPNSKAFLRIFSASVILSPEKSLIFPPQNMTLSDLPAKNASAATGTLYFAAFMLPKTIIQSTLAPLSFKSSNKRPSIISSVRFSFVIFDTHILCHLSTSSGYPINFPAASSRLFAPAPLSLLRGKLREVLSDVWVTSSFSFCFTEPIWRLVANPGNMRIPKVQKEPCGECTLFLIQIYQAFL